MNNLTLNMFLTNIQFLGLYADPGSGALIWQLLVGAMVGLAFYFRIFYQRLKGAVSRKTDDGPAEGN